MKVGLVMPVFGDTQEMCRLNRAWRALNRAWRALASVVMMAPDFEGEVLAGFMPTDDRIFRRHVVSQVQGSKARGAFCYHLLKARSIAKEEGPALRIRFCRTITGALHRTSPETGR